MGEAVIKRDVTTENSPYPARDLLAELGLRATRPRLALAELLFGKSFRHVSAESLHDELVRSGASGSISSVYRNLKDLSSAGLIKRVPVYGSTTWFDTQTEHHYHFFAEDEDRLIDVSADRVTVTNVPPPPDGYEFVSMDVLLRIRRCDKA